MLRNYIASTFLLSSAICINDVGRPTLTEMCRFSYIYGTTPFVCTLLWSHLAPSLHQSFKPKYLIYTLRILRLYIQADVLSMGVGCDDKTFRYKVTFNSRCETLSFNQVYTSIDGTDVPIEEPRPFSKEYHSHNLRHAGLKYEVRISIYSDNIVQPNGPYKHGEYTDLMIFPDVLKHSLGLDEVVVAHHIYRDPKCARKRRFIDSEARVVKFILSRHEILSSRFKRFAVLRMPWRYESCKNSHCFGRCLTSLK